jgi:hypothetical protein
MHFRPALISAPSAKTRRHDACWSAADMPSAERTGRIAGRYTTQLKGCAYTYEATWREAGDGVIWSATLKRDDQLIGTPTGQIRAAGGVNLNDEVRRLVESAIEARANKK